VHRACVVLVSCPVCLLAVESTSACTAGVGAISWSCIEGSGMLLHHPAQNGHCVLMRASVYQSNLRVFRSFGSLEKSFCVECLCLLVDSRQGRRVSLLCVGAVIPEAAIGNVYSAANNVVRFLLSSAIAACFSSSA
jgi:hypothetical protein